MELGTSLHTQNMIVENNRITKSQVAVTHKTYGIKSLNDAQGQPNNSGISCRFEGLTSEEGASERLYCISQSSERCRNADTGVHALPKVEMPPNVPQSHSSATSSAYPHKPTKNISNKQKTHSEAAIVPSLIPETPRFYNIRNKGNFLPIPHTPIHHV